MSDSSEIQWDNLKLIEKSEFLANKENATDCSFIVGGEIFPAHKLILASASPVFQRMFFGDFKESNTSNEISVTDAQPIDFHNFLDFIYYENIKRLELCSIESLKNLIYLGKKYMIEKFEKNCFDIIYKKMETCSIDDLIRLFEYGHQIEHKDLIESFEKTIKGKKCSPPRCVSYKYRCCCTKPQFITSSTTYSNMNIKTFVLLLNVLRGLVREELLFNIIETYYMENYTKVKQDSGTNVVDNGVQASNSDGNPVGKSNLKSNDVILNMLLQHIDYESFKVKTFLEGPGKSNLLDIQKKYEILEILCQKQTTYLLRVLEQIKYQLISFH